MNGWMKKNIQKLNNHYSLYEYGMKTKQKKTYK